AVDRTPAPARRWLSSAADSAADVRHLDPLPGADPDLAQLGVPVVPSLPARGDQGAQLVIVGARAQRPAEIEPVGREQAREQPAVDAESRTGAVAAERAAHRHD